MFGDSVAESLAYVPEAGQFLGERLDLQLHLASCRRLASPSRWYMGERPPTVLDIVQSSSLAQLGRIVVVDVGYNEPAVNYEANMSVVAAAPREQGCGARDLGDDARGERRLPADHPDHPRSCPALVPNSGRGLGECEHREGLVQHRRPAPECLRSGRSCNATPTVHPCRMRFGVRERPYGRSAAKCSGRPCSEAPHRWTPPDVPPWLMGGDAADRHVVTLASQRQGRCRRSRQPAAPARCRREKAGYCQVWAGNSSGAAQATSRALLVRAAR
jgi:hypothetical protein